MCHRSFAKHARGAPALDEAELRGHCEELRRQLRQRVGHRRVEVLHVGEAAVEHRARGGAVEVRQRRAEQPLELRVAVGVADAVALEDVQRSDRVIAEAWDLTFGLVEGDVEASLMTALAENVPLQEAGRQHPRLLVISRANRSVRNFSAFIDSLSDGQQPPADLLKTAGYLYRTTAVYGNGKFGIADYGRLKENPDFRHPFSAQMSAVYVLRQFSICSFN